MSCSTSCPAELAHPPRAAEPSGKQPWHREVGVEVFPAQHGTVANHRYVGKLLCRGAAQSLGNLCGEGEHTAISWLHLDPVGCGD